MPQKYSCIESTVDMKYKGWTLRFWINQDSVKDDYLNDSILVANMEDFLDTGEKWSNEDIVRYVQDSFDGINAVQIKRDRKFGVVAYLVPFTDLKG